ncbi:hypothetical protein WN944_019424 [Citrus x changshan-huyou]|uniref:Uncharacterized protein n=1 Tax=Citrus x changshan-huyou TaxID=2935761 RepID=A0AAP0LVF5_9ROSI
MKIKERKISFKRIEPWIPQARTATKRGFLDRTSSSQTRAVLAASGSASNSSTLRHREQFRQPQQFPANRKYVLGRPMEVTKPLMFASAFITFISLAIAFVKVLWLSVYMLSITYGAAVLVGASSSFLLSKLATIIGHATLLLFLWHRARNVDLSNNASIFSFYMFIWQAIILCRIPPYSFCTLRVNEELDVQAVGCVKTYQPPVTHIHGVLNRNQRKKYAIKCSENSFYPTNRITERNDVVCKPFNNNDRVTAVKLQDGNASKSQDGDESPKNVFLKNLNALYRFMYPYAFFGVLIATTSNSLLPVEKLADLTPTFFIGLLKPLVTSVLMNIYVPAVNQVTDVEIDKVNKPYMPLASGEFSMETGIAITWISALMSLASAIMLRSPPLVLGVILWLFIATAYSAQLPFLRWKGNSFLAAVCVVFTCGLLPQVPFFFHVQKSYAKSPQQVVSELDPSSRNVVVEQLRCVGRKDRSPAVVSSEGGIVELLLECN